MNGQISQYSHLIQLMNDDDEWLFYLLFDNSTRCIHNISVMSTHNDLLEFDQNKSMDDCRILEKRRKF